MKIALGRKLLVEEIDLILPKAILILDLKVKEIITAQVVSIGSDVDNGISLYDIVYIKANAGIKLDINGEELISIWQDEVIAAWREE